MYARSTSIAGDAGRIDACIEFVRDEVMGAVDGMDGWVGLSLLVDREAGRCIATTSWRGRDELDATEAGVAALRDRAEAIMGGEAVVDHWEIAVMHREHEAEEGSWCRVTWLRCPPSEVDATIDAYKDTVLPRLEREDEFCSASFLVDRETGRCCGTARFESHGGLVAARELSRELREEMAQRSAWEFTEVAECELVIAHLRVPELV